MPLPLLLLLRHETRLVLGQSPTLRAGELGPEIERKVLLLLVEDAELMTLVLVDDGEDAGDGFADVVAEYSISIFTSTMCT